MLLKDAVPPIILQIQDVDAIFTAQQMALDELEKDRADLLNQFFVQTATWGLDLWEELLGMPTDKTKSYGFRRESIIAKLRGQGTSTKQMIKSVAETFTNYPVEVIEDNANYRFFIKFIGGTGIPTNIEALKSAINEIKPAHLLVEYVFIYNTYQEMQSVQFKTMNAYTWHELRVNKLSNTFTHQTLSKYTHKQLGGIL